jgi:hypothetical protein
LLAVLSLFVALPAQANSDPYEPNDVILDAAGPLANHQTYTADLDAENDKDFFFFYVTSPASSVALSMRNLGGGRLLAYTGFAIQDSSGVTIATAPNIEEGQQKALTLTLEPQKYFVEAFSSLDYGATYTLEAQGSEGAFGPFATIAGHCATARSASATAQSGVTRAEAKLQRATARVRRSRYSSRVARETAQGVYRKSRAKVTKKRNALRAAKKSQQPWCTIPQ